MPQSRILLFRQVAFTVVYVVDMILDSDVGKRQVSLEKASGNQPPLFFLGGKRLIKRSSSSEPTGAASPRKHWKALCFPFLASGQSVSNGLTLWGCSRGTAVVSVAPATRYSAARNRTIGPVENRKPV